MGDDATANPSHRVVLRMPHTLLTPWVAICAPDDADYLLAIRLRNHSRSSQQCSNLSGGVVAGGVVLRFRRSDKINHLPIVPPIDAEVRGVNCEYLRARVRTTIDASARSMCSWRAIRVRNRGQCSVGDPAPFSHVLSCLDAHQLASLSSRSQASNVSASSLNCKSPF